MRVDRADFDDLVTLVTQAPPWDKDRAAGVRLLLRAIAESKPDAPDQILARWTWKLARAVRKTLDRKASQEYPDAKRLLGALANSRGQRHEENAARLVKAALEMPREVGAALLATAEGYTPRATNAARRRARAARHDPGDRRRARGRPARSRRQAHRARGAGAAARRGCPAHRLEARQPPPTTAAARPIGNGHAAEPAQRRRGRAQAARLPRPARPRGPATAAPRRRRRPAPQASAPRALADGSRRARLRPPARPRSR